ncbi:MAG: CCA tRNA nucleotidyltransferase, partial [Nanoarchaeota archaeon]
TEEIRECIERSAQESSIEVEVVPGGSTAKGTFLKGDFDIDMFVRFQTEDTDLSRLLEIILGDCCQQKGFLLERVHGSRDYFNFTYKGFFFEIVPVKSIRDIKEADNVTDMSPLHVLWVQDKLTETIKDDIMITKQFCKANGTYGAESYINGFSGHVIDILVIHHGGFEPLLEAASTWKRKQVIDPEQAHDNPYQALNKSKLHSPLILIDPIDPYRNAAAALSAEQFKRFIDSANRFLKHPSNDFFTIIPYDRDRLVKRRKQGEALILISIIPHVGKKDVVGMKVMKIFQFLKRHLQLHEFTTVHSKWWFDKNESNIALYVKDKELSPGLTRQGPPISKTEDAKRFRNTHENVFESHDRLYATIPRQFVDPKTCIRHLLTQPYVTERCNEYHLEIIDDKKKQNGEAKGEEKKDDTQSES